MHETQLIQEEEDSQQVGTCLSSLLSRLSNDGAPFILTERALIGKRKSTPGCLLFVVQHSEGCLKRCDNDIIIMWLG